MPNGEDPLDKHGCEYGRRVRQDMDYVMEDISEIKECTSEIKGEIESLRRHIYKTEWLKRLGAAIVGAAAYWLSSLLR